MATVLFMVRICVPSISTEALVMVYFLSFLSHQHKSNLVHRVRKVSDNVICNRSFEIMNSDVTFIYSFIFFKWQ